MSNGPHDNTTIVNVYIELRDRRLYCFRRYGDKSWRDDVDYYQCNHRQTIREATEIVWEGWIRPDAWGY